MQAVHDPALEQTECQRNTRNVLQADRASFRLMQGGVARMRATGRKIGDRLLQPVDACTGPECADKPVVVGIELKCLIEAANAIKQLAQLRKTLYSSSKTNQSSALTL